MPLDIGQIPNPGSLPGDFHAGSADVNVSDARVVIPQLLGEKDRVIAGATACNEYAKSISETLAPAEAEVIQLSKRLLFGDHQTPGFVVRIAQRKRILLILSAHIGCVIG